LVRFPRAEDGIEPGRVARRCADIGARLIEPAAALCARPPRRRNRLQPDVVLNCLLNVKVLIPGDAADFVSFVRRRTSTLLRTVYLLTGHADATSRRTTDRTETNGR
jgi:hypothetical protein